MSTYTDTSDSYSPDTDLYDDWTTDDVPDGAEVVGGGVRVWYEPAVEVPVAAPSKATGLPAQGGYSRRATSGERRMLARQLRIRDRRRRLDALAYRMSKVPVVAAVLGSSVILLVVAGVTAAPMLAVV